MKLQTRLLILFMIYFMIIVKYSKNNYKLKINKHSRKLTSGVWTETLKFI